MEWVIVAVLVVLNMILTVWIGARCSALFQNAFENLDGSIAAAIKSLVEQGVGDFEPINPVQAAIAQFITARMGDQKESVLAGIPRAEDGKFSQP
jgi:hypothetical protein